MVEYQGLALSKKASTLRSEPHHQRGLLCERTYRVSEFVKFEFAVVDGKLTDRGQIRRWYTFVFVAGSTD